MRVTNNSWGGGDFSQALSDAIAASGDQGILFVASAGSSGKNTDTAPQYPSCYDLDNILAVAATTRNDALAGYSNYGLFSVDLAAPGSSVLSTYPGAAYATFSGTSMAAPHVAGVAALLLSAAPQASVRDIRDAILAGVDPVNSLSGKVFTGGRLNAAGALEALFAI